MGMDIHMVEKPTTRPDWYTVRWADLDYFRVGAKQVAPFIQFMLAIGLLDPSEEMIEDGERRLPSDRDTRWRSRDPDRVPLMKFTSCFWITPEECLVIARRVRDAFAARHPAVEVAPFNSEWWEHFAQFNQLAAEHSGYDAGW